MRDNFEGMFNSAGPPPPMITDFLGRQGNFFATDFADRHWFSIQNAEGVG